MSFNSFMQTVAFLLKMWKIRCIFQNCSLSTWWRDKLRQTRCIDKNTVLRHAEYLTTTLLKDVTLVWMGARTSKTSYRCKMYAFFILRKKHCSIFVNIFYNKRCNYWLCGLITAHQRALNSLIDTQWSSCFLSFLGVFCSHFFSLKLSSKYKLQQHALHTGCIF